ncbi:MAG: BatA domain-containing protein, partial [Longimicrobiales bacterium]
MIGFGAPGFLIAGAAAALAALALHLIVHTPPRRAALPTARFLSGTRASMIRVRRTPSDVLLLAVRMLFALAFGAAFARPVWTGGGPDSIHVVLLDRGVGMGDGWRTAVDSARTLAAGRTDIVLVTFDTAAVIYPAGRIAPARIDSLAAAGPALIESDYRVAFRALQEALAAARAARYAVTLVTAPRWSAYREGSGAVRRAAWPGPVRVVSVTAPPPQRRGSRLP